MPHPVWYGSPILAGTKREVHLTCQFLEAGLEAIASRLEANWHATFLAIPISLDHISARVLGGTWRNCTKLRSDVRIDQNLKYPARNALTAQPNGFHEIVREHKTKQNIHIHFPQIRPTQEPIQKPRSPPQKKPQGVPIVILFKPAWGQPSLFWK